MTTLLSITAQPDAPVACDMTDAEDTLAERLAEYRRLFDHALIERKSTATTTTFRLTDRPGVRDWVLDLVRREATCCPFQSYEITQDDEQIVWTTSGGLGTSEMAVLDELLDAPPTAGSTGVAERLEEHGFAVILPPDEADRRTGAVPHA